MSKSLVTIKMLMQNANDSAYHIEVNNHMATRNLFLEMKGSTIANQFVAFLIVH